MVTLGIKGAGPDVVRIRYLKMACERESGCTYATGLHRMPWIFGRDRLQHPAVSSELDFYLGAGAIACAVVQGKIAERCHAVHFKVLASELTDMLLTPSAASQRSPAVAVAGVPADKTSGAMISLPHIVEISDLSMRREGKSPPS